MDKGILQRYSTWAKENLENQIEVSLKALGINDENNIKKAKKVGDVTTIEGDPTSYPADLYGKRERIIDLVKRSGYRNIIEEFAYTWFNRFVALRFMEVHGFLSHGFRVLSDPTGGIEPEILKNLNLVKDELHLNMKLCSEYKQQSKVEELFRYVLIKQCDELSKILPMLFSTDFGYLELLLPNNLLKGETVITRLNEIPETAFLEDVEIIGWMYQFYISSKKDEVFASKKTITKDTLPAVTQLFTPDWIVRYMAQNSVGRLWLESYPDSPLRAEMKYYVEDAEQTEEVQKKIDEIKYRNVNPEDIRIIEPCCGSGHILVYVFDLLYKMYEERGYQKRDIPTLILRKNLVGLDVDKRAAQLASFSLIMKARSVNNRFFNEQYYETPHVYEIQDSKLLKDMGYRKHLKNLNLLNDEETQLIHYIVDTFENGKTIGSLLKVKPIDFVCLDGALDKLSKEAVADVFNIEFLNDGIKRLRKLSNLAKTLSDKYDVMITNPPYINPSSMEGFVKEYSIKNYPNSKSDMFSMFMETDFVIDYGFIAMINLPSWMFLTSYEGFRKALLQRISIVSLLQLGRGIFGPDFGTTAFVLRNCRVQSFVGSYKRLFEKQGNVDSLEEKEQRFFTYPVILFKQEDYGIIAGSPIAFWISDRVKEIYSNSQLIEDIATPKQGFATTDNNTFLRYWFEIPYCAFSVNYQNQFENKEGVRWVPYNKGGAYRPWYGNLDYVCYWKDAGHKLKNHPKAVLRNMDYQFKKSITWSLTNISYFGARARAEGSLFDTNGMSLFTSEKLYNYLLAFLCTKPATEFMKITNPTLASQVGDIARLPIIIPNESIIDSVNKITNETVMISKSEWDSFEFSWDFDIHPLVSLKSGAGYVDTQIEGWSGLISDAYRIWQKDCQERFSKLKANEEELNKIFIDLYGLQDELTPEVEDKDVTVRLADRERDIRSFISYLVGVAMGRYSLDVPGIAYAGGEWDASKYVSFQPDDDGIIPIYNGIGMEDGLTTVLIGLIKQIYGEDTYRQNIDFIADALGKNNNESSEETLNRYLNDGFYADHLKIYQKRPIYWLFSSGKKAGFKCLIYMHRYNEDTLARINAKYFLPESTRKKNELEELNVRVTRAEGREKIRLEKQRQQLAASYNEAIEYGQVLDHMANQYISIDLDDGVKVNYAKFQGIEIVTDSGSKVKKDLLAPLK